MKKWLTLTLLLFCIPALVWGWGTVIISGSSSSGGGTCGNTPYDSNETTDDHIAIHNVEDAYFVGQGKYSPDDTITVCKVSFYIGYIIGDVSSKYYRVRVWDYDGVDLDNVIATSDVVTNISSPGWVDFTFTTTFSHSSSSTYAYLLEMSESNDPFVPAIDADNYIKLEYYEDSDVMTGNWQSFRSDGTRTGDTTYRDALIKIFRVE